MVLLKILYYSVSHVIEMVNGFQLKGFVQLAMSIFVKRVLSIIRNHHLHVTMFFLMKIPCQQHLQLQYLKTTSIVVMIIKTKNRNITVEITTT
jgi:hypothetical protein